jgi:hypothetical protein
MRAIWMMVLTAVVAGCSGEPETTKETETSGIRPLVEQVAGCARDSSDTDPEILQFKSLFVDGAMPPIDKIPEYGKYDGIYCRDKSPSVSGEEATFTVTFEQGTSTQEATWTAVRVDDRWKLKDTPLP